MSTVAWLELCFTIILLFLNSGNSGQNGGQSNPSCGGLHSMNSGETKSFYCVPLLAGQFVFVRIPSSSKKVLTLCEVQVYSTRQNNNNIKGNLKLIYSIYYFFCRNFSVILTKSLRRLLLA